MALYSNEQQLNLAISKTLVNIVNEVTEIFLNQLEQIIDNVVYSYSATWEYRTGQFKDSWEKTRAELIGNVAQATIYDNSSKMTTVNELWIHGNPWSSLTGNAMASIIENGLSTSNFNFPAIEPRPFWSEFEKWADQNFERIFVQSCKRYGLNIVGSILM